MRDQLAVFFCASDPNTNQQFLYSIDGRTGEQNWVSPVNFQPGPPSLVNDTVVLFGDSKADLNRTTVGVFDRNTGVLIRSGEISKSSRTHRGRLGDLIATAALHQASLELLDPSTLTLTKIYEAPGPIVADAGPVYADAGGAGRSYLTYSESNHSFGIAAVRLADGFQEWTLSLGEKKLVWTHMDEDSAYFCLLLPHDTQISSEIWRVDLASGGVVWRVAAPGASRPTAVFHGSLIVQDGTDLTVALKVRDGSELYRFQHAGRSVWAIPDEDGGALFGYGTGLIAVDTRRFWTTSFTGAVRGTPMYAGTSVLVGNADGRLTAVALESGQTRWTRNVGGALEGGGAIQQGRAFVGHGAGVTAFDIQSGQQIWSMQTPKPVTSPILATPQAVVFGCRDGTIRALLPLDGSPVWTVQTQGFVEGGVALYNGLYVAGSADGKVYALDANGQLVWQFVPSDPEIDEIKSTPLVADDLVIVGNASGHLFALDASTGALKWHRKLAGGIRTSSALQHTDHVWIGDESGQVYHLLLQDGSIDWQVAVAGAVRGRPAWLGGELYVGTMAGTLDVLDIFTGTLRRRVPIGAPVFASPIVALESIVVADEAGGLHTLVPGP
ncbi:PQQ-binding-like beta-propeller repeat protein [Rhodoferax sp. AJA081-3]|uniref:outer membrane protein assembly factor BamB family protein n=1 Tax=Rhodoferax sp. AJA081-3 TaxID=2752316 RepID=UPI00353050B6